MTPAVGTPDSSRGCGLARSCFLQQPTEGGKRAKRLSRALRVDVERDARGNGEQDSTDRDAGELVEQVQPFSAPTRTGGTFVPTWHEIDGR